ncbi:trypsin-like serine peptidase [Nonomuraea jiangxiensis]|uniref:Trypsin n=1 Tax=Nonomuraea jiangxiensis TaxID=633440 RepID=A0A1G9KAV2_9ACTN|nr:trypsin-like serine protease [Nonomuraea jiangxiensis]SDL46554.1 Trypsin [Nonomuraea jiangxiensis]
MIPRARHLVAAALSAALLVQAALTGIANAAPTSRVYAVPLAKTVSDVQRVAEYWRPDRLQRSDSYIPATPGAQAAPTSGATVPGGPVPAGKRTGNPHLPTPAMPSTGTGTMANTMGKVFFTLGGKEYWCSASSVAAPNRSVVATAGHCVYDPRQAKAAENWVFVPNPLPNGQTPFGIYVGSTISMHEDWTGKGDYDYDYAFVTVHRGFVWTPKNGSWVMKDVGRLQDNVGGLGLELNNRQPTYQAVAFGYPAGAQPDSSRPFDGKTLRSCTGTVTRWTQAPNLDLQKGVQLRRCDFSPGASGGPWLTGFDQNRMLGNLTGVNSLTWDRDAKNWYDAVSSPYFDTATGDVYQRAATQTTPSKVT